MPNQIFPEDTIELPDHLLEAALVTEHVFQTTPKTVKSWPLPWECPNGRAIAPPATYLAYAIWKARKNTAGNARWFRATAQTADAA